ncbi:cell division protein ZapE [Catenovulum sp. 2E275]|uniref:cell division protein ZapE n=1 Tax=Catenovulum sp. 2E275 TaxID=2980497 RepID=UPI0021D27F46|nr:cell division protein ZapE [Catenovulum sp. 2E275]MCU4675477.1 cell division protein ZapE [Catenovulum sp. 2E275]
MTTPLQQYQQDLSKGKLIADPAQAYAVDLLEKLYQDLNLQGSLDKSWLSSIKYLFSKPKNQAPQGLYFWGGVGRGKTYLMDLFYNSLPFDEKYRVHFHRFMRHVHQQLDKLKGQSDPLELIAEQLSQSYKIICFDEFFVSDITDAMLLAGLMQALFKHNVVFVATSNIPPDELYKNGLQRARFVPAIELIKQYCQVFNLDNGVDYRMRTLTQAEIYHFPLDQQAEDNLLQYFKQLAVGDISQNETLTVENRPLKTRYLAQDVVWFDFYQLCDGPRSQNDYIELSRCFNTVLLSGVKQMGEKNDDIARRFIAMVDEFYERHVKLIISAEVELTELYTTGRLNFEFKRCISRLQEMQSKEYLALAHLA